MMLKVLYEDNHVICVIKPINIPSQSDSTGDTDMLTLLRDYVGEKYNKPGNVYIGLVHRLDRPAGGVMVFARTSKAAARLSAQFAQGQTKKEYLAVLTNTPKEKTATLENYLVKDSALNISKVVLTKTPAAKLAVLDYEILETFGNECLVKIMLHTGRSHQIRLQFSHIGCPLLGDAKYGNGKTQLALWSYALKFAHPTQDKNIVVSALPESEAFEKYKFIAEGK